MKRIVVFSLLFMFGIALYAACQAGFLSQRAYATLDSDGRIVTHCGSTPYNAYCCWPKGPVTEQ